MTRRRPSTPEFAAFLREWGEKKLDAMEVDRPQLTPKQAVRLFSDMLAVALTKLGLLEAPAEEGES